MNTWRGRCYGIHYKWKWIEISKYCKWEAFMNWKHFGGKGGQFIYMFQNSFSGNLKVIELVHVRCVERLEGQIRLTSLYWTDPLFTPGQTGQKIHYMLQEDGEKKGNTTIVLGRWSWNFYRELLQSLPRWGQLRSILIFFIFSFENSMYNNYHTTFFYTFVSFPSQDTTFFYTFVSFPSQDTTFYIKSRF